MQYQKEKKHVKIKYEQEKGVTPVFEEGKMKSITQEQLERFNKQYKKNTTFNIVRHALSKNSISNIAYVNEQEKETQNHFTIDLNKLPILNQGKSRR